MSLKKFLSVLLALIMVMSSAAVFATAAGAQTAQSDIAPVGDNNREAGTKTITVGLDSSFQNKVFYGSSATSAPFQMHYWGGADGEGDVELVSINEKESMLIAEYDIEVEFYLYSAKIPADSTGFKARKGNNWFGDDADMSVDHVYMYMYHGEDKFIYEAWGEEPTEQETQEPTQPETRPLPTQPWGTYYYIVGDFTDWEIDGDFKLYPYENGLYVFEDIDLALTSQFKVVKWEPDGQAWYPDGMGNNYGENGEITAAGTYDVYFDPTCSHEDWFGGCIYVDGMPDEPVDDRRPIEKLPFANDLTAGMDTVKVYFQMPDGTNCFADEETGEYVPSWENENNKMGINYAGIYWWQGSVTAGAWPGAKMTLDTGKDNIFSAKIPDDEDITSIIFNNAVDGGTDTTAGIYDQAFQTVDLNVQGAEPGEYDTLPEGTPDPDSFDGCIFVPDQGAIFPTSTFSKTLYPGRWYIYYGNGCYGMYARDSENFTFVKDMCCNPSHHHEVKPVEKLPYADNLTAEIDTVTVYFQMPDGANCFADEETGEHVPSWENENNLIGTTHYAGIYWWQGSMTAGAWPGAKMTPDNIEDKIFSANIPADEELTNVVFNNAVDGGADTTAEIYDQAFQTVDLNVQGAEPGDYDTLPEGSPDPDSFDGCIFVPDMGAIFPTSTLSKTLYPGRWYVYYGGGCYGMYAADSDHFTTVKDMCCNPDHDHSADPPEPEDSGYYLVGNFTNWAVDEAYKMTRNEKVGNVEYMLTSDLRKDSSFKVVYAENGELVYWYPDGMGDYPSIPVSGNYTVYFRPNFDGGYDWYYYCIYVDMNYAVYKLGDVNNDDEVDTVDATFIQRYATKVAVPFSEDVMMQGDVDGDGEATIVDATYIQRFATNIAVPYPIGEEAKA